jgi:hypothetical protein
VQGASFILIKLCHHGEGIGRGNLFDQVAERLYTMRISLEKRDFGVAGMQLN